MGKKKKPANSGKVIDKTFDPKNREVTLLQLGKKYKVIKPATGFASENVGKEKAQEIFAFKAADSQNQ